MGSSRSALEVGGGSIELLSANLKTLHAWWCEQEANRGPQFGKSWASLKKIETLNSLHTIEKRSSRVSHPILVGVGVKVRIRVRAWIGSTPGS